MEQISVIIRNIEKSTTKELGGILDSVNREVYSENDWNVISVKSGYVTLLAGIESEIEQYNLLLSFGNEVINYNDCSMGSTDTLNTRQVLGNLKIAQEYFQNPPILTDPKNIDVNSINWNGRDIFFPEEVQSILNIGTSTYKRWVDGGWLSETQVEGSNKRYVQKKDIIDFINNKAIYKESWR